MSQKLLAADPNTTTSRKPGGIPFGGVGRLAELRAVWWSDPQSSGFESNKGVVVIAATNRADILDQAE